jgi:3-deoxy-7-phosphoheptulonate synthase
LSHVRTPQLKAAFENIIERIEDSLDFMRIVGADTTANGGSNALQSVDLYTSHEGLMLEYEEALTRVLDSPATAGDRHAYNTSAHFLWIGDRTRQINGAHVESVSCSLVLVADSGPWTGTFGASVTPLASNAARHCSRPS